MGWGHVTALMGQVPARVLAGAVVRRAARNVESALGKLQVPPTDRELLAAFGAQQPGELARIFAAGGVRAHASSPHRAAELRVLAAQVDGLSSRAMARGQRVLQGRFDVFGREVNFGAGEVRWLEDPVTGHTFPGPGTPPVLPAVQGADPKRVWTLSRADWAVALAQAAWLDPDHAGVYAARFVSLTDSLLAAAPVGEGVHAAATMEVSLRAMNLTLGLCMFRGQPALEGRFLLRTLKALTTHARYVLANLEDAGAVPNNHLVGDLVGLLHVAALLPELPGAAGFRTAALFGLKQSFTSQVLDDGMGFEGSTGYHRLLLELGLAACSLSRSIGGSLGPAFEPALQRMLLATRSYLHADGTAPNLGDHDSGRALPFTDRAPLEHAYLPALGAALFHDARLKAPGAAFPDEAAWLLGEAGRAAFEALPSTGGGGSAAFPSFGLAVLRRGPLSVAFSAGSNGQRGVGGHGHNDKLGVEIIHRGQTLIADGGTCSYVRPVRDLFRGTALHSTVQVDGLEQSPILPNRPFALPDLARAELIRVQRGAAREVAVGTHRGYARLANPVFHRREVSLEAHADAVLIVDDLTGKGRHTLCSRFLLAVPQARIRPLTDAELARLGRVDATCDWNTERAVELGPAHAPLGVWVGARGTTLALTEGLHSPAYDACGPAACIEVRIEVELPVRLAAIVLPGV
jgi:hypothetical protein